MKKMPLFLGAAAAVLTLASCEKELEQATSSPKASAASTLAKPDLLTSGNWHQTGLTMSTAVEGSDQKATSDLFSHAKPSMLVTSATYSAGGTYTLMRGARPGAQLAEPASGKWQLSTAADSLTVTQADNVRHLAVDELTATSLRLTYTEAAANGKGATYTSVFSH